MTGWQRNQYEYIKRTQTCRDTYCGGPGLISNNELDFLYGLYTWLLVKLHYVDEYNWLTIVEIYENETGISNPSK